MNQNDLIELGARLIRRVGRGAALLDQLSTLGVQAEAEIPSSLLIISITVHHLLPQAPQRDSNIFVSLFDNI